MLSIVIPVYNEEGSIHQLIERLFAVIRPLSHSVEVLLVDDGSSDHTWNKISEARQQHPEIKGIRLSRNFGHQGALLAGLSLAQGDAIISMDGDLQHPPELIPQMVLSWEKGSKIVLTKREDKVVSSAFKRVTSNYFYRLFSSIAEADLEPGTSDFRLLDRSALDELLKLNFGQPFLRGAVQILGYPRDVIKFQVEERFAGDSKYTLKKMISFARHGFISHSSFPLKIGIWFGLLTGIVSILELIYVVVQYMTGVTVPGWASTIGIVSLFSGVMFFLIGLIGLYIEDIHQLLKNRPHFIISERTVDQDSKS